MNTSYPHSKQGVGSVECFCEICKASFWRQPSSAKNARCCSHSCMSQLKALVRSDKAPNPTGTCQCGCGQITPIANESKRGRVMGEHLRYCYGHHARTVLTPPNPSGLCFCGCGKTTPIATQSNARRGSMKGEHVRFIPSHKLASRKPSVSFVVDQETGCWIWQGSLSPEGYGQLGRKGSGTRQAHRWYYEQRFGPIPKGLELDHVKTRGCIHRSCVNPDHLEPVTPVTNARRSNASKLTIELAREIRSFRGIDTYEIIAERYSVCPATVSHIMNGRSWKEDSMQGSFDASRNNAGEVRPSDVTINP